MKKTDFNPHMGIDDILWLLGGKSRLDNYGRLNMILWSLQEQGAITFNEDALDDWYNEDDDEND